MPDLISVIFRRWRLLLVLTLAGTLTAFVACLLSLKLYLGKATALPANTLVNDKARIFNRNVEALYSEIGTADELDKLEGTSKLDTLYLAVASTYNLPAHYNLDTTAGDVLDKAVLLLKKNSDIGRTGFGELKVRVWDKDNQMAADLANALLQTINAIHERLQTENNKAVLQKLQEAYAQTLEGVTETENRVTQFERADDRTGSRDTLDRQKPGTALRDVSIRQAAAVEQLGEYSRLINEYELAVKTAPRSLLVVEHARPSPWYDKPKTVLTVALAFLASLLFSFLLAVFVESRKVRA